MASPQPRSKHTASFFSRLPSRDQASIRALTTAKTLSFGNGVATDGKPLSTLAIVEEGTLGVHPDGSTTITTRMLAPGDCWYLPSILAPGIAVPQRVTVTSTAATIRSLPLVKLFALMKKNPALGRRITAAALHDLLQRGVIIEDANALTQTITALATHSFDAHRSLAAALPLIAEHAGAHKALVARFDRITQRIIIESCYGYRNLTAGTPFALINDQLLSLVFHSKTRLIADEHSHGRAMKHAHYADGHFVAEPLMNAGIVEGVVAITAPVKKSFSPKAHALLTSIAVPLTLMLKNANHQTSDRHAEMLKRT